MRRIIDIRNLEFNYPGQGKLLSNFNLKFETNTINGLIGKNGEGKTTLLKLICGLLFPHKGEIEVLEYDPRKRNPKMLEDIFFLPEEIMNSHLNIQNFEKTYAPFYPNFSSSTFFSNLNDFGIDHKIAKISDYSYGQRKKFMIAFGLATKARLIIMDEPTNGLDIPSKRQFRRLVTEAKDKKSCILISTHQVFDLENIIDKVIILENHEILFNQLSNDILKKLEFKVSQQKETNEFSIYGEETSRGYCQIMENKTEADSNLDLELLFNAMILKSDKINQLFKSN